MTKFADNAGNEWVVDVTVGVARDCRKHLDFDLCELPGNIEAVGRLRSDDILLADVLYLCCRNQCSEKGVSDEQFGHLLTGDVMDKAEESLWESLSFFFRGHRSEQLMKTLTIHQKMTAESLANLTPEMEAMLTNHMAKTVRQTIEALMEDSTSTA